MRLGAPLFGAIEDENQYISAAKKRGYRAMYCPGYLKDTSQREEISRLRRALEENDIVLSEVGAWCNPVSPDSDEAQRARAWIVERLRLADELRARCCVNILGSVSTDKWYAPAAGNFTDVFLERCVSVYRGIIDEVKPKHTKMAFEVMPFCLLDCADGYLSFLRALDREEAAVHLDLVNLINSPRTLYGHRELFDDAVEKLGKWTVSAHVKDIRLDWEPVNTKLDEVRLGLGEVDMGHMLDSLAKIPGDLPVMLEHLNTQEEYDLAAAHLKDVARLRGYQL